MITPIQLSEYVFAVIVPLVTVYTCFKWVMYMVNDFKMDQRESELKEREVRLEMEKACLEELKKSILKRTES